MNIESVESLYDLWVDGEVTEMWKTLNGLSTGEFAYAIAWITYMLSTEGERTLSAWIFWLEAKSKNN
jgi:hypothetical protein